MNEELKAQVDGLLEKYTELLFGETSPELKEQVQGWVLYSHIAKSMPPLVQHWNSAYPDAKEDMRKMIADIKVRNEQYRNKK
ncbi:YusU family protein [Cytobacillus massiliigabonensis]|uniref:YusU family protein n=1 Tax=Cytobacillus massiliigabonensis TaxID=1871011 RepID=UPI000C849556|nr:YusU family protein [Cytobacillus massiliigabonensis]